MQFAIRTVVSLNAPQTLVKGYVKEKYNLFPQFSNFHMSLHGVFKGTTERNYKQLVPPSY